MLFFVCFIGNLRTCQDESVRLWNVHTGICILIFAGAGGHRNEVLSVVSILDEELCPATLLLIFFKEIYCFVVL